jgi:hypothetical protein
MNVITKYYLHLTKFASTGYLIGVLLTFLFIDEITFQLILREAIGFIGMNLLIYFVCWFAVKKLI